MFEELLREHGAELIAAVTRGSSLDANEAERLVPPALDEVGQTMSSGRVDPSSLLGGGAGAIGALLSQLDLGRIAGAAGVEEARARSGVESLLPVVLSLLGDKAGGVQGLLTMLGGGEAAGGLGGLGGLAGKLFGK